MSWLVYSISEEQLALHLSPSQGDKQLVHSKPPKSSQGKKSRVKRDISKISYNPLVVWQDNEDLELIPVKDQGKN